jgi:hypothetical protein
VIDVAVIVDVAPVDGDDDARSQPPAQTGAPTRQATKRHIPS